MSNFPEGRSDPAPPAGGGFDLNNATIISLLYLGSFITGITGIVGVVLAYVWRDGQDGWEASHFTYLIRTFWIGLLFSLISIPLMVILIGVPMIIATSVWFAVRSITAMMRAQKREPIADPLTWWI